MPGITHPYLNVGRIEGGTNTNVVPGKVVFKLDRRMIPEENPAEVEADDPPRDRRRGRAACPASRSRSSACCWPIRMKPLPGNKPLVEAIQKHGQAVFGEADPGHGHAAVHRRAPVRRGRHPGVIYGAGPRTVLESHAKRADERLELEDLRRATKVVARTLLDLLR